MQKIILFCIVAFGSLYATSEFETSKTCKGCHPTIYGEFYESAHRKSSIFKMIFIKQYGLNIQLVKKRFIYVINVILQLIHESQMLF